MNARELGALGIPQDCVGIAFDALKASGLISQPAEATQRIGELAAIQRPSSLIRTSATWPSP